MTRASCFLGVALLCAFTVGCGPSEEPLVPVEGKITFEGKPLTKGSVGFHPDVARNNLSKNIPHGVISDGRYKMMTQPRDGAPVGWYKVTVNVTEPSDPKNPYSLPRSLIPERFSKVTETELAVEVRTDAPAGAYDLELKQAN
jgi:hypothetical protein